MASLASRPLSPSPASLALPRPQHHHRAVNGNGKFQQVRPKARVQPRAGADAVRSGGDAPGWAAPNDDAISPEAPLRVLVAGGGLGGLFAAISLRNAGRDG
jgi:hypothetical protein